MPEAAVYIRKSPATLAMKIIIAEIITELVYAGLHYMLFNFSTRFQGHELGEISALLSIGMTFVAILLFVAIVAVWAAEGVLLKRDELIYKYGVFDEHRKTYPYLNMQRIEVDQSILGKMMNFGTVTIYLPVIGQDVHLTEMPSPHEFVEQLKGNVVRPSRQQYLIKR